MTEEEQVEVSGEAEAEEVLAEAEEALAEVEPGEEEVIEPGFVARVFFHTGTSMNVKLPYGATVDGLRKVLENQHNRRTYGNTVLVDGARVNPDDEVTYVLDPGQIVTFSGTVKGG